MGAPMTAGSDERQPRRDRFGMRPPNDTAPAGCDQCQAVMIQGVFCHEAGCPSLPTWPEESDDDFAPAIRWTRTSSAS